MDRGRKSNGGKETGGWEERGGGKREKGVQATNRREWRGNVEGREWGRRRRGTE